jgi:hypothetical protein
MGLRGGGGRVGKRWLCWSGIARNSVGTAIADRVRGRASGSRSRMDCELTGACGGRVRRARGGTRGHCDGAGRAPRRKAAAREARWRAQKGCRCECAWQWRRGRRTAAVCVAMAPGSAHGGGVRGNGAGVGARRRCAWRRCRGGRTAAVCVAMVPGWAHGGSVRGDGAGVGARRRRAWRWCRGRARGASRPTREPVTTGAGE